MTLQLLAFSDVMRTIGSVLLAILVLLVMVTIHEFGHYIAGKLLHFKINEFAVGFGPAVWKHTKKNGEIVSLRALPLGGYCAFDGEEGDGASPDSFNNKKPWQRIIVLVSGALMNYLLALVIIVISFFSFGQLMLMTYRVDPAAATENGIAIGGYAFEDRDVILRCEGKGIYLSTDLMNVLNGKKEGDLVGFTVARDTGDGFRETDISVMMRKDAAFDNMTDTGTLWECIGIAKTYADDGESYRFDVASAAYKGFGFFQTIGRSFMYSFQIGGSIFQVLGQLLTGHLGMDAFGGPVTTIKLTSQIATLGIQPFLEIAAFIGVNLAVFNLLPIPALDGSKIVFTAIEWVRGKPINRKVENIIHVVGFFAILGFALLADLLQFI